MATINNRRPSTNPQPALTVRAMRCDGRITRIVRDRGFGFIQGEDHRQYFFHMSGAAEFEALQEGTLVAFEVVQSAKGPRAEHVERRHSDGRV